LPAPELFPMKQLHRTMASVGRRAPVAASSYDAPPGNRALRVQIARRAMEAGCTLSPDDIITTTGATEALNLCLRAVAKPGDVIAIESPTFFGILQIIESLGMRGSPLYEAAELLSELVTAGARTICFMKSRKGVELILRHTVARLEPQLAERVAPYRAGYTPGQRREIQRRLTSGELLGVVATDALELGIDIGALDAAICVTYPGTAASLKQMWGRAGRRGRGLAVYIAGEDALDQFFCRHPDELLRRPVETAIIDPESPETYAEHLLCAEHEAPLTN